MAENIKQPINKLPPHPGIYIFKDKTGSILYVGKAKNLRTRVRSYFNKTNEFSLAKQDMMRRIVAIETEPAATENEALILEAMWIKKHKPPYNIVLKDDKDYSFIKIDYAEEYPTVAVVRRLARPMLGRARYFGPFTSSYILNENLRFLRRIFPYRKKNKALTKFETDLLQKRSIGPVPQNEAEYLDMIKRLEKIINGQTASVKRGLKKIMQTLSRQKQYETAAKVRNQIKWLDIFTNRQKIVSAKEYLEQSISLSTSLSELQTVLGLKELPQRIEGYDISNIQGQHSVGSMVVFTNAEPDKNEYRKFKIKTVKGANDVASLAEVLKRRFAHTGWPKPDLILLDGGKGQLSTVLQALFSRHPERSEGSRGLPMRFFADAQNDELNPNHFIALAKRDEEIFQGPDGKKINLSPASAGSRLLQRVRDEAHRFAQSYYHVLHSKSIKAVRKDGIIKTIGKVKTEKLLESVQVSLRTKPAGVAKQS
ncbi:MAG: GIY-YIG nuclease family protein [Candidatus Komeilibacteria bacterium]|nr:GIY-YIG nuclease family protein [Candidatus Komeilibacteria bacterium]